MSAEKNIVSVSTIASAMAFKTAAAEVLCDTCGAKSTYFKLNQSWRSGHTWYDEERERSQQWRICNACDLCFREEEWEQKSAEEKAELGQDWPSLPRIEKDQKKAAKGELWVSKGR